MIVTVNISAFEQIFFGSDALKDKEIEKLLKEIRVQKQRWLGTNHPDSRVRAMAFRASGVHVGERVKFSLGCKVLGYERLWIGDGVQFGDTVSLITDSSPDGSRLVKKLHRGIRKAPIFICDDAWIGSQSIIMPGITIGTMATVGAGSIVTHDVPAGEVWYGVPARKRWAI